MIGKLVIAVGLGFAAAACGGDDCEKLWDKTTKFLAELQTDEGAKKKVPEKGPFLEQCREKLKNASDEDKQVVKCMLDASTADAFGDCKMGRRKKQEKKTTDDDEPAKLAVTDVTPAAGDAAGGTYVVIKGSGFTKPSRIAKVYFGETEGTVIRFQSDRELIVQAPGGTADETVDLRVTFEPGGTMTIPKAFKFVTK